MPAVADFKNDCFVSYSHLDNVPFGDPPRPGWVAIFHKHLQDFVAVHAGRTIRVWCDARLTGAEIFSDHIEQQLRSSAVLVSIISPGYLQSTWCRRELQGFADLAHEAQSLRVGSLQRVIKVLRLPVEQSALPAFLKETLGAKFYSEDPLSKRPRDLLLEPGSDKAYLAAVDDVAQDIKRLLEAMMSAPDADPSSPPGTPAHAKVVFLAWTTSDLAQERERLRRDLVARGFRVVPAGEPPLHAGAIRPMVLEALHAASVAIHLIGSHYGFVPEGDARSVVELQGDDAVYRESGSSAARIFWLADGGTPRDARLSKMLERIQAADGEGGTRCDVMAAKSLEDLKTLTLHRLTQEPKVLPAAAAAAAAAVPAKRPALVYLLCDQLDRADVAALRKHLFDAQLDVRTPLFAGDVTELRDDHEALLKECAGVLIYWGHGKEAWLRKMLRDMGHVFGSASSPRVEPYAATCLYIAGPPSDGKLDFMTREVPVLREAGAFVPDSLRPFVGQLTAP